MRKLFSILLALTIAIFLLNMASAAEHPGASVGSEHPGAPTKTEHKEHPGRTHEEEHPGEAAEHPGKKEMLSANEIIKGIKSHISKVTKGNNGYYPLFDSKEGKDLRLKLIGVHEDKVSYIKKDGAYFACTDFVTDAGVKYDVDFWMKKDAQDNLEVYQTKIHKKEGKPRFTYQDDEIVDLGPAMAPEAHT